MLTRRSGAGPAHPSPVFVSPTPHWLPAWLQECKCIFFFFFLQDTLTGSATSTAPGCLWMPGTRRGATTASVCASCSPAMGKAGWVKYCMRPVANCRLPCESPPDHLVVRPSINRVPGAHLCVTVCSDRDGSSQSVALDGSAAVAAYQPVWLQVTPAVSVCLLWPWVILTVLCDIGPQWEEA